MVRSPYYDKNGLKRGAWSKDEDERLRSYIQTHGPTNWRELPESAGLLRCGKSCRLRWVNHLRPNLKHGNYTQEEDEIIIKLHERFGNKWSKIADKVPGRTDNNIKNRWHSHLKKRSECNNIRKIEFKGKPCDHTSDSEITHHHTDSANPISVGTSSFDILESSLPMSIETLHAEDKSSSLTYNPAIPTMNGSREEDSFASWEAFEEFGSNFWTEPFIMQNSSSQDNCSIPIYDGTINGVDTNQYVSCFYDAAELFDQVMPELPKD